MIAEVATDANFAVCFVPAVASPASTTEFSFAAMVFYRQQLRVAKINAMTFDGLRAATFVTNVEPTELSQGHAHLCSERPPSPGGGR